jgi:outer membrane protein assembly factor BamB
MFATILLAASAAPVPPMPAADWKPAIKAREFNFDDKNSGAGNSVDAAKKAGLTVEFQPDPNGFGDGAFTFQKKGAPKVSVSGHNGTPAVIRDDVLYVADFSPIATGCKVTAYDLATGKKGWEKRLDGIGPIAHTKYRNRVAMSVEKHPDANHFALVIVGWEASGRYVEVLDLTSGKQLAHKNYDSEK